MIKIFSRLNFCRINNDFYQKFYLQLCNKIKKERMEDHLLFLLSKILKKKKTSHPLPNKLDETRVSFYLQLISDSLDNFEQEEMEKMMEIILKLVSNSPNNQTRELNSLPHTLFQKVIQRYFQKKNSSPIWQNKFIPNYLQSSLLYYPNYTNFKSFSSCLLEISSLLPTTNHLSSQVLTSNISIFIFIFRSLASRLAEILKIDSQSTTSSAEWKPQLFQLLCKMTEFVPFNTLAYLFSTIELVYHSYFPSFRKQDALSIIRSSVVSTTDQIRKPLLVDWFKKLKNKNYSSL